MAYVAPNEDTVVVVGGLGTMADAAELNGGGATKVVWDANVPGDFIDVNGGPITADANAAFDYGDKTITAVGIGVGVTEGTLCYCDDGDSGNSFFPGIYEVTTVADNVLTFANIELSGADTDQANGVTCNVGGAIGKVDGAGLDAALANGVNDATTYNRYIYVNGDLDMDGGTITIVATIDVNTYGGGISLGKKLIVKGANSDCVVDGTRIIITTADSLATGLLAFYSAIDYTQWWYIDFNAAGATKADYCIYNAATETTSEYHSFFDCIFQGAADETGVFIESSFWLLLGCEIHSNGLGIWTDGGNTKIIGCSIHDNTTNGITDDALSNYILMNNIYDNGGVGIRLQNARCVIIGNTIFGQVSHGIDMAAGADETTLINNTLCGNGTGGSGFGINAAGFDNILYLAFNHSCDNDATAANNNWDGHCNLMTDPTSDSEWDDFLEGNNQHGDPKFANIGDGVENFTPTSGSPLIDNALDAGTA